MKLFNTIAASVAVAMAAGVAQADVNSQLASLQAQVNQLQSQVNGMGSSSLGGLVGINTPLSYQMMGNFTGVGKEAYLLQARKNGANTPLTIGGYAQANVMYGHTNTNGQFGQANDGQVALTSDGSGTSSNATRLLLSNVDLSTTAAIGQWVTGYVQVGSDNIGESTAAGNTNLGIQDAYLVFGNLANNPLFAFVGNKDIDFGNFSTVDMFNQPLTRGAFEAHGNTIGIGANAYGFNGAVSAMNGGNTITNQNYGLSTSNQNNISNYAVNLSYGMTNSGVAWNVGAGYLNGSQYQSNSGQNNGAWDLNGKVSVAGFDLLAEYVATTKQATGVNTTTAVGFPSVVGSLGTVSAYSVGADYNFPVMGLNSVVSAEYSHLAYSNASNNNMGQYVVGYRIQPITNVWTGLEYAYNKGNFGTTSATVENNAIKNSSVVLDVTAAF